jgi:ubiquinone/menaquinone biosynthesis C-methylase UbiE
MDELSMIKPDSIMNVNAGFDETSDLLVQKYPDASLRVLDFYDPDKHTEISIQRARNAYPPFPGTLSIETNKIPLKDQSVDAIFAILSAHEIRDKNERILFFQELNRTLKENGSIIVTEHLRDIPNFLAYTIGFFHFHSKRTWLKTFQAAGLKVNEEIKITSFLNVFVLKHA